jgi:hypothetical protein
MQWLFGAGFWVFMMATEGYGGFQRKLSPRFAARALFLKQHPSWSRVVFAPFFCVGYFQAPRKRMIASYALTLMIVGFVMLVSRLDQPWRGLVDLGVISGLAYGIGTLIFHFVGVVIMKADPKDPELAGSACEGVLQRRQQ